MAPVPAEPRRLKLLAQVRQAIRVRHYSDRTEEAYVGWVRRFVRFCGMRHPAEVETDEVSRFLLSLANAGGVAASTQNQAASALQFLFEQVLGRPLARAAGFVRAKEPGRLPVVLTPGEAKAVLAHVRGGVTARRDPSLRQWASSSGGAHVAGQGRGFRPQRDCRPSGQG